MTSRNRLSRRRVLSIGATSLATAALQDLVDPALARAARSPGARPGIGYFARFGIDEALIRHALSRALATGGDHADVFFQHRVTTDYSLEDGEVNRASKDVELGVGVRVVKGDQTGYGYTEDLTRAGVALAARTAGVIANGGKGAVPARLHVVKDLPSRYPVKVPWEKVTPDQRLAIVQQMNDRAMAADRRIRKANVRFSDQVSVILIADSSGRIVEDVQPMTRLYLSCVAEDSKGRREQGGYNVAARADIGYYEPDRLERVVRQAVARTLVLFDAVQPEAGEMPVVLAAGSSGILLHEAIGHGLEGDFNRKGTSIYADRMGKPIARPFVNIVDDGTQQHARGAINVDDEGNVAQKTMLVTGGVLTSYLHDMISARHYKMKGSTGSGRRESYQFPPMPRMRSTYMLPGPHKKDEIIASVKKGIYCTNFANGQVKIGAGDFTFYVQNGYLIEDGKLTRPIKDVNIIGNGPKILEKVDMVADDLEIDEGGWTCGKDGQSVPVSQGLPTVRVAAITVGGRQPKKG
jgi:TldD protein